MSIKSQPKKGGLKNTPRNKIRNIKRELKKAGQKVLTSLNQRLGFWVSQK